MADQTAVDAQIGQIPGEGLPGYANFLSLNHGPHDFHLTFGLVAIPPGGSEPDEEGRVTLTPHLVADLMIPASAMPSIIAALTSNLDRYVSTYGEQTDEVEDE